MADNESFEACLGELEQIVKELEGGELTLDRSLELFERGMSLSDACRKQLEAAETRVDVLLRKDGKMTAQPFRPEKS
jgi:exodeoxyribonuclease VII small subunit